MSRRSKLWAQLSQEGRSVREVTLASMGLDPDEVDVLLFDQRGVTLSWVNKNRQPVFMPYATDEEV